MIPNCTSAADTYVRDESVRLGAGEIRVRRSVQNVIRTLVAADFIRRLNTHAQLLPLVDCTGRYRGVGEDFLLRLALIILTCPIAIGSNAAAIFFANKNACNVLVVGVKVCHDDRY